MTDDLVEAVFDGRLPAVTADAPGGDLAALAAICRRIGERVDREREALVALLTDHGVEVVGRDPVGPQQRHTIDMRVAEAELADRAAAILAGEGWERWEHWRRGAAESFRRTADRLTMARTTDVTIVVRIAWADHRQRSRFDRLVRPSQGDWSLVELPETLWWAYPPIRITRLIAERVGWRQRFHDTLGPFLSTPDPLIGSLLEFAEVAPADTLVDIGCGDGRIAVASASERGAAAIGIDNDPGLIDRARQRADTAGVADQVQLLVGDARTLDLSDATVVFMFLPVDALANVLPEVRARLTPGSRIITHEQHRLPIGLQPDATALLTAFDAVSVAHRFDVT